LAGVKESRKIAEGLALLETVIILDYEGMQCSSSFYLLLKQQDQYSSPPMGRGINSRTFYSVLKAQKTINHASAPK